MIWRKKRFSVVRGCGWYSWASAMYVSLIGEFSSLAVDKFDSNDEGVKNSWSVRLYVMVMADSAEETMFHPWRSSRAVTFAKDR